MTSTKSIDNIPKNQHYVPQSLLNNFAHSDNQIHAYDKKQNKSFSPSVRNIGAENYFYRYYKNTQQIDFDPSLHTKSTFDARDSLEGEASRIIKLLLENENLYCLSSEEIFTLKKFMTLQRHRVPTFVNELKDLLKEIDPSAGFPEDPKELMNLFIKGCQVYHGPLERNDLYIAIAPKNSFFILSDNPVCTQRRILYPDENGNRVEVIKFFMPISPKLCLLAIPKLLILDVISHPDYSRHEDESWSDDGCPIKFRKKDVDQVNKLQCLQSQRFLYYFNNNCLKIILNTIKKYPKIKNGSISEEYEDQEIKKDHLVLDNITKNISL